MSRETELEQAFLEFMAREQALRQALGQVLQCPDKRSAGGQAALAAARAAISMPAPPVVTLDKVRKEALRAMAFRPSFADDRWRDGVASLADALGANVDDVLGDG